jgi:NitT/TauT family transport system substrate-binding protein
MLRTAAVRRFVIAVVAAAFAAPAQAQDLPKVAIGISGWTGFAPLTLAAQAGIFKKNGVDVSIKKIPQKDRHLAIASGDIQCAATTVETWLVWNANGVATTQIFQMDKSYGADGMAVRGNIAKIADLKGKTVAASAPGTAPYFTLAWFLKKNGLSVKDVTVVNLEPAAAAQAFIAGQNDAAMTYEPFLSSVRDKPEAGRIIATTLDYPMIMDTFGCTPKFIKENPKVVQAIVNSYFEALAMIKADPKKSFEIMGADVKQSAEAFEKSQSFIRWQDREANRKFFAGEWQAFSREAGALLLELGIIKQMPDLNAIVDTSFIK